RRARMPIRKKTAVESTFARRVTTGTLLTGATNYYSQGSGIMIDSSHGSGMIMFASQGSGIIIDSSHGSGMIMLASQGSGMMIEAFGADARAERSLDWQTAALKLIGSNPSEAQMSAISRITFRTFYS